MPMSIIRSADLLVSPLPGMYHAHIDKDCDVGNVSEVGSWKACPLLKSLEAPVLAVCVNTAGLLPAHGPKVWVVGESPDTVRGPSGLGALSAKMLDESKV